MTELGTVRIERPEPGAAILRLHRPGQLNALVAAMFADIRAACEQRPTCGSRPRRHAAELMFTGTTIDAGEAARIGLVNRVVPEPDLLADALATARAIAGYSPFGMALSKRALQANLDAPSLHTALEVESRGPAFATRDPGFADALEKVREQFMRQP